jgi:leucyl aminopeptidase
MDIKAIATTRLEWTGDLLAIGFFEDAVELSGDLAELNTTLADVIAALIAETEFKGAKSVSIPPFTKLCWWDWVKRKS